MKLGIVEHTGHGIPKIIEKYGRDAFDIHESYLNVITPFNRNVTEKIRPGRNDYGHDAGNLSDELTENEKRVLLELIGNPAIPYDTIVLELGVSRRTVSRIFVSLVDKGYIERVGTNKKGYWKVIR